VAGRGRPGRGGWRDRPDAGTVEGVPPFLALALPPATAPVRDACGPAETAGDICTAVFQATHNAAVARLADLLLARPARILLILAVAFVVNRLVRRAIRRFVTQIGKDKVQRQFSSLREHAPLLATTDELPTLRRLQRAETIGALLRSVSSFTIWVLAGLTALETLGVNLGPLVAATGIVGVALGFGSQNLVRDFISGSFMLLEDQYGVGDVIDVGPASGTVEGVGLRTTRVRDVEGVLWHVPNGEIRRVGNKSQGWSRALLDVEVAYATDLPHAIEVIERVADELWRDEAWSALLLEQPEVWGVEELGANGVKVRLVAKTRPLEQWKVERELRARIKGAFERDGVTVPLAVAAVWPERDGADAGRDGDGDRDGEATAGRRAD
jgi:moderate conductance mechanosensitive channel